MWNVKKLYCQCIQLPNRLYIYIYIYQSKYTISATIFEILIRKVLYCSQCPSSSLAEFGEVLKGIKTELQVNGTTCTVQVSQHVFQNRTQLCKEPYDQEATGTLACIRGSLAYEVVIIHGIA